MARNLATTLDRPIELWGTMFATVLSEVAQRVVLTLVTFSVGGVEPETLRLIARNDARPIDYTHALRALEGTFIEIDQRTPRSEMRVSYANPSIRDFVLATLDDEPEYGLGLVVGAQHLGQIRTLLQYADSMVDGVPKFPTLAAALTSNQQVVVNRINQLITETVQAAQGQKQPKYFLRSVVIEPLAALLLPAQRLMPEMSADFLTRALTLADGADVADDPDILRHLTRAVIVHANGDIADVKSRLYDLICGWGRAMYTAEDVEIFIEFAETNEALLMPYFDLKPLVERYTEDALRNEVNNMSMNRHDEQGDLEWLDSVERLAERIGIAGVLHAEIEAERTSIHDHYAEQEPYDPAPTSGASYGWPSPSAAHHARSHIGAIFQQLS